MKEALSQTLVAIFFGLCLAAKAQSFDAMRADAVYHPETILDPASLLSPGNFSKIESGRYVVVEGYIDYRATTWPEPDGDYHFEMQTTDKLHTKNPTEGLVCEIGPVVQLEGSHALKEIDQKNPATYRKVRDYSTRGWVRLNH